jgi:flagellar hook-associated protein 3 FlgL
MRISSSSMYDVGIQAIQNQQAELVKAQQQLATGRRVITASDDPVAAARVLDISQSLATNEQYIANGNTAKSSLENEDSALSAITNIIQDVRTLAVAAGNGSLNASNLSKIGIEVRQKYQELLGVANHSDANGRNIFSGYLGSVKPFTQASGAGVYAGDQGKIAVQIGTGRQIEINDTGADIFKPGVAAKDVFQTISDLADALQGVTPFTSATPTTAISQLDVELNNVLQFQAGVGAKLKEIDAVQSTASEYSLNYKSTISNLQDVDVASAISELTKRHYGLQAAQQSYIKVTGLSLFNYLQ